MLNQKKLLLLIITFHVMLYANAQTTPVVEIYMKASGLQYELVRFSVRPGATVRLTLTNNDDMPHNMIFTQPGAREEVVNAALKLGEGGTKANFIPPAPNKVLWYIPLLSPGQTESITFTAPAATGVYPYVCTFPGHGIVMYGAMYVGGGNGAMPPLKDDQNIPPSRRQDGAVVSSNIMNMQDHSMVAPKLVDHPYPLVPPYVFRAFLPDTGPDAIGVSLPQQLSYCWDAGTCRLRYAWQGGFLDFQDFWKSYKRYAVKVIGNVFYRDKSVFPLRIDVPESIPAVKFKGYSLIARYPEFHYTINGIDVYELIYPKTDGTGLIRTFRIPKATKPIWFTFGPGDGADYTCLKGQWVNGKLKLSPAEAQLFSIVMTKKEGVKL